MRLNDFTALGDAFEGMKSPVAAGGAFDFTSISGCQLWIDGADGSGKTESEGKVAVFPDKSGNDNHATQDTQSKMPTHNTTDGIILGTDQYLVFGTEINYSPAKHIFIVFDANATMTSNAPFLGHTTKVPTFNTKYSGRRLLNDVSYYRNDDVLTDFYRNSVDAAASVVLDDSIDDYTSPTLVRMYISTRAYFDTLASDRELGGRTFAANSKEILVYNALSAEDIATVESELMSKWGIS